ncbi:MAG: TldD/PmbA family protein [Nitrospirales bacterium]
MAEVNLTEIATDLLGKAKQQGADGAEVMVADGQTLSVQVRMSAVECLTKAREKRLGLRVFVGHRSASSSTSDFSPESLDRVVADTCALAQAVAEDETSGLPDGDLLAKDIPDLDLWDETNLDTDTQIRLAKRAEEAALKADPRITNSEGADFHSSGGRVLLANSLGFQGEYRSSSFSVSVSPVASEKDGQGMQRDAWYAVHRKYAKLASPESVGREAARRALRRLGARKVSTTRAPVVFDQETAATLLAHLCGALSGYGLYKGASFLIDRLHTRVAPEFVTVCDDGRLPGGLGTRPFDGDGLPTRKNVVVDRGILTSYLLDTYSGRKLGMASTGNASRSVGDSPTVGPTNFYLQPGTTSPQDIIKSVTQGLYVTELIGFGVNMVTGDYSRGAAGLWIENGELAYPVEEITIAGNLKDIYADIELVGNDLEFRSRIASPTLKIRELTIAGN